MLLHNLNWSKNPEDKCYTLEEINPTNQYFEDLYPGVYLIWQPGETIYAGQGNIGQRLAVHRQTYQYARHNLLVSWAEVPTLNARRGIEVYLHKQLEPRDSTCNLTDYPIPVTFPWGS